MTHKTQICSTFGYRPEIDGLRAIAVTSVVLYHTGFGCRGGFTGVDVFFVISGYLITSLIWRKIETGRFTFLDFLERRARRIIPALVTMTLTTLIAGYYILLPSHLNELGRAVVSQSLFAANFFYWQHTGYFATSASQEKPLLHTWSLAVEEQFYIIVPFLLWGIYQFRSLRNRNWLLGILGLGFILSFTASVYGVIHHPSASFYLLPTRAWELLFGSIIAFLPPSRRLMQRPLLAEVFSLTGILLITIPVFTYGSETRFPGMAALPPCAGAAVFIWANNPDNNITSTRIAALFSSRLIVFIGLISYSWYLWHWPILAFGNYLQLGHLSINTRILLFFIGFFCAVASWRYIETPFREKIAWNCRRAIFMFSCSSLAFTLLGGFLYSYKKGFPHRVSAHALEANKAESDFSHVYQHQARDVLDGNVAIIGLKEPGSKPALLVWGDSHAMAALPAIDKILTENNLSGRAATRSSTAPVIGWVTSSNDLVGALEFNDAVLAYVERENIRSVLLHSTWPTHSRNPDINGISFEDALYNTVKHLKRMEVDVYFMHDVPVHPFNVPKMVAQAGQRANLIAAKPNAWNLELDDPSIISKIEKLGAMIIDPKPAFLDQNIQRYRVYADGAILYRDKGHLTTTGALKMLKPLFIRDLKKIFPQ